MATPCLHLCFLFNLVHSSLLGCQLPGRTLCISPLSYCVNSFPLCFPLHFLPLSYLFWKRSHFSWACHFSFATCNTPISCPLLFFEIFFFSYSHWCFLSGNWLFIGEREGKFPTYSIRDEACVANELRRSRLGGWREWALCDITRVA
jgi:hypothetical protein